MALPSLKSSAVIAALAAFVAVPLGPAAADTLKDIYEDGVLTVGVKADYRPWGYRTEDGEIVGLEIDMAQELADRLGVELEKVVVVGSNRMEFLNQGQIDLIIATMGDNPKRREVIGMIEPNYYAGGTNILAPKSAGFKEWADLDGRKICGIQGAYYNRRSQNEYNIELVAFKGVPEASNALRQGACQGFLYDNTWIESQLASDESWADFEMPFQTEDPSVWALGVRKDDLNGPFGLLVSGFVTELHRSGWLKDKEVEWGITPSQFLAEMNERLASKVAE